MTNPMEKNRYPVPPDMTTGQYVGGLSWPELGIIATTAVIGVVVTSSGNLSLGLFLFAIPAAIAIMCRRHDTGAGYTNAMSGIVAMARFFFAEMAGGMEFSLRRMLQLDRQQPIEQEDDTNGEET